MKLDSMYQEIILDHYRHPHHKGLRDEFGAEVHHVNPTCGDEVTLRVHLANAERGQDAVVRDVSYESVGCSISQASASVMTDLVIGKTVGEALKVGDVFLELMQSKGESEGDEDVLEDAVAFAGVSKFPARVKCALLGWMALKDATAQALRDLRMTIGERMSEQDRDRAARERAWVPSPRWTTSKRRSGTWSTRSSASTWWTSG